MIGKPGVDSPVGWITASIIITFCFSEIFYLIVGDEVVSSIGKGICVLVGISRDDTTKESDILARKILNLRIFDSDAGKRWNKNVMDKKYEVLCVSQFTLECIMKGNKPDFHAAMGGEESQTFYNNFLEKLKSMYSPEKIKDGRFGAYMQVNIQNDGPVTIPIEIDSSFDNNRDKGYKQNKKKATVNDSSSETIATLKISESETNNVDDKKIPSQT
ncbi:unnamed protein product [Owenia fusiformis]|uniref:D-aminoacyl-tRNA deacylase n=1 Tax=Owenia fusiformis TaxID=6347 RepID=A0A8S4PD41_OWEFU|nr:unnamed protein product [Owenia fusiformis]